MTTINAVTTLNSIYHNEIKVSLMDREDGYQIYFINKKGQDPGEVRGTSGLRDKTGGFISDLIYTDISKLKDKIKCAINNNKIFYLTFCGVSNNGNDIPDYYYVTLTGHQVKFDCKNNDLIFNFKINASLEKILKNIFKENIGLFIQVYL